MGRKITPKPGEFWQKVNYFGDSHSSVAYINTGLIYGKGEELMFASFYWPPKPIDKKEMIHGENDWTRIHPEVIKRAKKKK